MARYEVARWFRVYMLAGLVFSIGGGLLLLAGAAIAHDAASIAPLVIGCLWLVIGLIGVRQWYRTAMAVELNDESITFVGPRVHVQVPLGDVLEIRKSRGDMNMMMPLRIRTRSQGVIKLTPRLRGLIDMLVRVRAASPETTIRVP